MKKFLNFGGKKAGKGYRHFEQEWDETDFAYEETEEYAEQQAAEAEYIQEEYEEEEYIEEYTEGIYSEEGYVEEGVFTEEYAEDEYVEEYSEDTDAELEYSDEEYTEEYTEEYSEGCADSEEMSEYTEDAQEEFYGEISYEEEYITDEYEDEQLYEQEEFQEEEEEEDERKGLLLFAGKSDLMDKLVIFGSIAAAVAVLLFGVVFVGTKMLAKEEGNPLQEVGLQLGQIDTIGGKGLLAVSDAQKAAIEAAKLIEEEKEQQESEYEEIEYKTEVTVSLSLSSIEKDLKIKFINKDTGKLVGNVPFSITVTNPDGKQSLWSDDDMDGIIYKKNLASGQYKIAVNAFSDVKYKKYGLPTEQKKIQVKETIEYNKVDVTNEVKTESQVDVQKEDTKKNETVVESYLSDTVAWVESTTTLVTYTEVDKTNIKDPMQQENVADQPAAASLTPEVQPATEAAVITTNPTVSGSDVVVPDPMVLTLDKEAVTIYADYTGTVTVSVDNLMENAVIAAESSDTGVASVAVSDKMITVTGVAAGSATITVNCSAEVKTAAGATGAADGTKVYQAEPVTCTVTVKTNPAKDTITLLKDNQNREVFVKDGDTYRNAVYADYYTYSSFYVKGNAKYTGWQTIGGNRYYYDASGKAVTGEQVIQGVKYNFASDGVLVTGSGTLGIDVSKWNGNIDWNAVKNSGVSYVIIRCGYRGSSQGALIKDSKFESNIKGAVNAGLKVGVYFFTQAIDKSEALEEASMVLDCIKNYSISYPIFLDVEPSGGRADGLDAATRTEICKTFCETIQNYGYTAGIYANRTWLEEKINTGELSSSYKIWLAQYASEPTYTGRYDMWQYKSTGKIDGISGDVDMNLSYLGY